MIDCIRSNHCTPVINSNIPCEDLNSKLFSFVETSLQDFKVDDYLQIQWRKRLPLLTTNLVHVSRSVQLDFRVYPFDSAHDNGFGKVRTSEETIQIGKGVDEENFKSNRNQPDAKLGVKAFKIFVKTSLQDFCKDLPRF